MNKFPPAGPPWFTPIRYRWRHSLGLLPNDPTKERLLIGVTDGGSVGGVEFCIDSEVVDAGTTPVLCDSLPVFRVRYSDANFRAAYDFRLHEAVEQEPRPTLQELLNWERRHNERHEYRRDWMRRHRAKRRTPPPARKCPQCGKEFQPKRSDARFCSSACRVKSHRSDVSPVTSNR